MKVYIDQNRLMIAKWEREKPFYMGSNLVDYVDVFMDYVSSDYLPSISCELANGKSIGDFTATEGPEYIVDEGKYRYRFYLSSDSGQLSCKGPILITIAINYADTVNVPNKRRRVAVGVVHNTVFQTSTYSTNDGKNIIVVYEDNEEEVIMDFFQQINQNLPSQINNLGVRTAVLESAIDYYGVVEDPTSATEVYNKAYEYIFKSKSKIFVMTLDYTSNGSSTTRHLVFYKGDNPEVFSYYDCTDYRFRVVTRVDNDSFTDIDLFTKNSELGSKIEAHLESIGYKEAILDEAEEKAQELVDELKDNEVATNTENINKIKADLDHTTEGTLLYEFLELIKKWHETDIKSTKELAAKLRTELDTIMEDAPEAFDQLREIAAELANLSEEDSKFEGLMSQLTTLVEQNQSNIKANEANIRQNQTLIDQNQKLIDELDTDYLVDTESQAPTYLMKDRQEKSFGSQLKVLNLVLPASLSHGYISSVTFTTGSTVPIVSLNANGHDVLLVENAHKIASFDIDANCKYELMAYYDGINVVITQRQISL